MIEESQKRLKRSFEDIGPVERLKKPKGESQTSSAAMAKKVNGMQKQAMLQGSFNFDHRGRESPNSRYKNVQASVETGES